MGEIRIAGNLIKALSLFKDYGHLQLVFADESSQEEIEVQAPTTLTLGDWDYPEIPRAHNNGDSTPGYGDADDYAYAVISLARQNPQEYWENLKEIHEQFALKGQDISYDVHQNSNSYISTLFYMTNEGSINEYLNAATPNSVNDGFIGVETNVLLNGAADFGFVLSLSDGDDFLRTGSGDDNIRGNDGSDEIHGGEGDDELYGGSCY